MNEEESKGTGASGETAVLPETAAQLVELERLQRALAEADERGRSHWEQYLRAVADLDNVRKRAQRDVEAANRYGLEKLVSELLPVKDSLDLAMQNAGHADAASLRAGLQATLQLFDRALDKLGVRAVEPDEGERFDPARHEAVHDPGGRGRRTRLGAQGGAARLRAQWTAAAPGPGDRGPPSRQ